MLRNKKGFTATELMVAMAIFGLLAVASIPAFGKFIQSWRLNGDIDQFAGFLAKARSAAVTKNTVTVFKFQMNEGTYFYFEDNNGNGIRDNDEYQSSVRELGSGITFASRGNANESGSITLENTRQQTRQVKIFGGTGNIDTD